jgi:hypothetical protein
MKLKKIEWQGATLEFNFNNETHYFDLSDLQFNIIVKILGLEFHQKLNGNNEIKCFSDDTLKRISELKGNPLQFKKLD